MHIRHMSAAAPTLFFVMLWSSGAILSEIGLRHGSPLALLILRYVLALALLALIALRRRTLLPAKGTRARVALTGLAIAGLYSVCYLLALDQGLTPGALATLLGIQPLLTLLITERQVSSARFCGLIFALAGLALVVSDGVAAARFGPLGLLFAGLSLLGITAGSILQKRETQAPWEVLPLQYAVGLACACLLIPFDPLHFSWDWGFIGPALWLAAVISVGATFLLYRLIARGNLVNVTSLFYLVPGVTAMMDWAILGNPMSVTAMAGLALVLVALLLVLRPARA
ncbi:MAG: DMT family transporter [Sphingopyxis sp.]|uniref:DMT family transporter n=1 Tax=Sphingopyxis sp. TaxID=1908224 RepID=UPI002AB913B9|nr:DMT family transporter [Sphingopyxis sp.]MDZ3833036.1 DMT family transporter [Sphingopyxis sp.]